MQPKDIIVWTCAALFFSVTVITVLAIIGKVKIPSKYRDKLFYVLIVEVVVIAVAVFKENVGPQPYEVLPVYRPSPPGNIGNLVIEKIDAVAGAIQVRNTGNTAIHSNSLSLASSLKTSTNPDWNSTSELAKDITILPGSATIPTRDALKNIQNISEHVFGLVEPKPIIPPEAAERSYLESLEGIFRQFAEKEVGRANLVQAIENYVKTPKSTTWQLLQLSRSETGAPYPAIKSDRLSHFAVVQDELYKRMLNLAARKAAIVVRLTAVGPPPHDQAGLNSLSGIATDLKAIVDDLKSTQLALKNYLNPPEPSLTEEFETELKELDGKLVVAAAQGKAPVHIKHLAGLNYRCIVRRESGRIDVLVSHSGTGNFATFTKEHAGWDFLPAIQTTTGSKPWFMVAVKRTPKS